MWQGQKAKVVSGGSRKGNDSVVKVTRKLGLNGFQFTLSGHCQKVISGQKRRPPRCLCLYIRNSRERDVRKEQRCDETNIAEFIKTPPQLIQGFRQQC